MNKPRWFRRIGLLACVLGLAPLLASCYVPDQFRAEIRLAANGDYSLSYQGMLTWAPVYMKIRTGELSGAELRKKVEEVRADLKRDPQFTEIRSLGGGQFAVKYYRTGNFGSKPAFISFVRRSSQLMSLESRDRILTVAAQTPNPEKAKPLQEAGLMIRGSLRVFSQLPVVGEPGAMAVFPDKASGWTAYDWYIDGTKPVYPKIVFRLP